LEIPATLLLLETASARCGYVIGRGYRVYFVRRGKDFVVLLCGGDKSSQDSDIAAAKKLAAELED
jgi:putative addiction module killer protein